jgi:hypothetical protein
VKRTRSAAASSRRNFQGRLLHLAHLRRDVARRGGAGERAAALLQLGAALLQLVLERNHRVLELDLLLRRVVVRAPGLLAVQTRVLALSLALHLRGARAALGGGGARLGGVRASLRAPPSLRRVHRQLLGDFAALALARSVLRVRLLRV